MLTTTKAIKTTKTTKVVKPAKNKVIAFRFALTPEIEIIINSLEDCFIGLDRSEIVKLALNQLYKNNQLDRDSKSPINQITNAKSKGMQTDEDFFEFWNKYKSELR